jgi:hypothetical protein
VPDYLDGFDTIPARWFTPHPAPRPIRVIVIHDMEAHEGPNTARNVAHYFAAGVEAKSSAHFCVDATDCIRCVADHDVAYAAPGCNTDGLQLELAGYMAQTREQWLDAFGMDMLNHNACAIVAAWCRKYAIPAVHLTNAELKAGARGIVGHKQVSDVYQKSDHQDPGPGFPWDFFLEGVQTTIYAQEAGQ